MTKKQRKILVGIVIIIALIFMLVAQSSKIPQKEVNEPQTIGGLMDNMDSLRTLKEECVNNLNIIDSAKFLKGETGYCDEWDVEIKELRNQINQLGKKDYEGLR